MVKFSPDLLGQVLSIAMSYLSLVALSLPSLEVMTPQEKLIGDTVDGSVPMVTMGVIH